MALGCFTRLCFFLYRRQTDPLFLWPAVDENSYLILARTLAESGFASASSFLPFWQPPGYSFLLAGCLAGGLSLPAIAMLQQAVGILNAILLHRLALRHMSSARALAAALAFLLLPAFWFFETSFLKPVWITFLLLAIFLAAAPDARPLRWFAAGLLGGILALFQPYGLAVAAALGLHAAVRRRWRAVAVLTLGCLLPILPTSVLNCRVGRHPVAISYNGGANFFVGNNPKWKETFNVLPGWEWHRLMHRQVILRRDPSLEGPSSEPLYWAEAFAWIRQRPRQAFSAFAQKASLAFSVRWIPRNMPLNWPKGFAVWHALLLAAMWLGTARFASAPRRDCLPLLFPPLVLVSVCILFFPSTRYMTPATPFLLLLAVAGPACNRPARQIAAMLVAVATMTIGMVSPPFICDFPRWRAFRETYVAEKWMALDQPDRAGPALDRALTLQRIPYALELKGAWLAQFRNNLPAAEILFREWTERQPDNPNAHYLLAECLRHQNRLAEAVPEYRQYLDRRTELLLPPSVDPARRRRAMALLAAPRGWIPASSPPFPAMKRSRD